METRHDYVEDVWKEILEYEREFWKKKVEDLKKSLAAEDNCPSTLDTAEHNE